MHTHNAFKISKNNYFKERFFTEFNLESCTWLPSSIRLVGVKFFS